MSYKVISPFVDKETGQEYAVGDLYKGTNKKRIGALSSNDNAENAPQIEKVKGKEESDNG